MHYVQWTKQSVKHGPSTYSINRKEVPIDNWKKWSDSHPMHNVGDIWKSAIWPGMECRLNADSKTECRDSKLKGKWESADTLD